MERDDIDRRSAAFAAGLLGPLGPLPLERVLRQHVQLFTDLRQTGASWRQIAALMVRHGVTRKDGQTVDATQWAAMVSRAEKSAAQSPPISALQEKRQRAPASVKVEGGTDSNSNLIRDSVRARMRKSASIREDG
jgi:cytosine/adenosine deaminase-related metal-dependent hydrolase